MRIDLTPLAQLKEKLEGQILVVIEEVFSALEECAEELAQREDQLRRKELHFELALAEMESLVEDLQATDPIAAYESLPTYEIGDDSYVLPESVPDRERQVLATLQQLAYRDAGDWVVVGVSNKDLVRVASTPFDPLTTGGVSAALTRLSRKGLIDTTTLSGRGYPRKILLQARVENPELYITIENGSNDESV